MKITLNILALSLVFLTGCAALRNNQVLENKISVLAESDHQWTGVGYSEDNRIFVCFPRWSENVPISVAELLKDKSLKAYPNLDWNQWAPGLAPTNHFISVESVIVDKKNNLWVLDSATPNRQEVIANGPKLVKIDLKSNKVIANYAINSSICSSNSCLNDVRIDSERNFAYISDSGLGAIAVIDLNSGKMRRVLASSKATKSDGSVITVAGKQWRKADGSYPEVNVDGIALDPFGDNLYFQALTAGGLYKIKTEYLRNFDNSLAMIDKQVDFFGYNSPCAGMCFNHDGNLYVSSVEHDAIRVILAQNISEAVMVHDDLAWPNCIAITPDGDLLVVSSQIHKTNKDNKYKLFKIDIKK